MNPIYQLTSMLAKAMFKKDSPIIPDGAFPQNSEPGIVLTRLRQLISDKNFNTAENLLFDSFDKQKPYFIAIGLEFYARLSEFSEKELEDADFSRDEIQEGLNDMMKFYGVKISVKKAPNPANQPQPAAPNVMADPPKNV